MITREEVRDQIRKGRIEQALNMMVDLFADHPGMKDDVDQIKAKFSMAKRGNMLGTLSYDKYSEQSAQVISAMLDVLSKEPSSYDVAIESSTNGSDTPKPDDEKKIILWFESNPSGEGEGAIIEWNLIVNCHRNSPLENEFDLSPITATRVDDFVEELENNKAYIFHFSGHGNEKGIVIKGKNRMYTYPLKDLMEVFVNTNGLPHCIFFNNCMGTKSAEIFIGKENYVIVQSGKVTGAYSVKFSEKFYSFLFIGKSIEDAFKLAKLTAKPLLKDHGEAVLYRPTGN